MKKKKILVLLIKYQTKMKQISILVMTLVDDQFTIQSKEPYFQWPAVVINLISGIAQTTKANEVATGTASIMAMNHGSLYAPNN